jgi:hypothetical protein
MYLHISNLGMRRGKDRELKGFKVGMRVQSVSEGGNTFSRQRSEKRDKCGRMGAYW